MVLFFTHISCQMVKNHPLFQNTLETISRLISFKVRVPTAPYPKPFIASLTCSSSRKLFTIFSHRNRFFWQVQPYAIANVCQFDWPQHPHLVFSDCCDGTSGRYTQRWRGISPRKAHTWQWRGSFQKKSSKVQMYFLIKRNGCTRTHDETLQNI